ncbi:hypothetical protein ACJX0J_017894 [Zea mays]
MKDFLCNILDLHFYGAGIDESGGVVITWSGALKDNLHRDISIGWSLHQIDVQNNMGITKLISLGFHVSKVDIQLFFYNKDNIIFFDLRYVHYFLIILIQKQFLHAPTTLIRPLLNSTLVNDFSDGKIYIAHKQDIISKSYIVVIIYIYIYVCVNYYFIRERIDFACSGFSIDYNLQHTKI